MSCRPFSTLDKVIARLHADAKKGVRHEVLQVKPDIFRQLCSPPAKFTIINGPHGPVRIEPHERAAELTVVSGTLIAKICHCLDGDGDAHVHLGAQ